MEAMLVMLGLLLAVGSSASRTDEKDSPPEVQLCELMLRKFNNFVDMVPIAIPISFPKNNEYFTEKSEVIFYSANDDSSSPLCSVLQDNDITLFRIGVDMRLVILDSGRRMEIKVCRLDFHLRLQKNEKTLILDPQLVDVKITGDVFRDGVLLDKDQADEILRPTLIKAFTSLVIKKLSYSGSRGEAIYVDPSAAITLFKQLFMSYISQIV